METKNKTQESNSSSPLPPPPPSSSSSSSRKRRPVLVLVNPHSGRGKSELIYRKKLLPFLESHNIEHQVFITETHSRVHDYIRSKSILELNNLKSIIVVSGDGLFHETINGLMSRKDWQQAISVPVGLVPTGSGNGLAYTLLRQYYKHLDDSNHLSKDEAIRICSEQAIQDETCQADLVRLTFGRGTTVWSFLSTGWGLLADIDIDSEWLRRFGEARFTIYGLLRSLTSVSYRGRLSYKLSPHFIKTNMMENDNFLATESNSTNRMYATATSNIVERQQQQTKDWIHVEDKFACVYAVYQSHISSVTKFSPKSTLDDELIYLTYIRGKPSVCQLVSFLLAIQDGSHESFPFVTVVPVTTFKLQPLESSKIVVDGEVIPWSLQDGPITADIMPKMIKLSWAPQQQQSQ